VRRTKIVFGVFFIVGPLILLRFFQLAVVSFFWLMMMPVAVLSFTLGVKWVLQNVRMLRVYSELWPVFAVAMAIAWLVHAGQFEDLIANTWLGEAFGSLTAQITVLLLDVSGMKAVLHGQMLALPPQSRVSGVLITPLCGGLLSFIMFTFAFAIVLFDAGRGFGRAKLLGTFVLGAFATFMIGVLRVYIVLLLGYYMGFDVMMAAHNYLGYVLFLAFVMALWYLVLGSSKRSLNERQPTFRSTDAGNGYG